MSERSKGWESKTVSLGVDCFIVDARVSVGITSWYVLSNEVKSENFVLRQMRMNA